jgi:hypothetical protein
VEIDHSLVPFIQAQVNEIVPWANERILERLERHRLFVGECRRRGRELKYTNRFYDFPVISRQEREILFEHPRSLVRIGDLHWRIDYSPKLSLSL